MDFILIIAIIVALYYKTDQYNYIIDDWVKREGYYTEGIVHPPAVFFTMKPSRWYRWFMIGMHVVNCWIIYLLWGFYASLIFAVHPMSVWATAWVTGNYYGTATYFTLVSYFILHQFPNVWGALVALPIFNAGINSVVCPMAFPFLAIFEPWLGTLFIMVFWLTKSERWKTGMKVRQELFVKPFKNDWRRPILMTKVVARYTFEAIIPIKTCMFIKWGEFCREDDKRYEEMHKCDALFWSGLMLITSVFTLGWMVSPFAISWFFVCIGLHSQWNLTGQFYAQRYLYLPLVGMSVFLGLLWLRTGLPEWVGLAYILYLVYKTCQFIPAFKDNEAFFRNDLSQNQEYAFSYTNLATHLSRFKGHKEEIKELLLKADEIAPEEWAMPFNLAKMNFFDGKFKEALAYVNRAIDACTDVPSRESLGELKKAIVSNLEAKR